MKKAPDFELPDQDGNIRRLKDYEGKWVVLYFYPKDDTPGCTLEACNFRDERESIAQLGNAEVIGVSKDSVKKHKAFADRYNLTFKLLSDIDGNTINKYGALKQKSIFGKTYMGIQRMTVIINPEGYIVKEYPKVNPKNHAIEIIKDLQALQSH